jgi:hypothetical protein
MRLQSELELELELEDESKKTGTAQDIRVLTHLEKGDFNSLKDYKIWEDVQPARFHQACGTLVEFIKKKSTKREMLNQFLQLFSLLEEKISTVCENKEFNDHQCLMVIASYKIVIKMLNEDMKTLLLKEESDDKISIKRSYDLINVEKLLVDKNLEILQSRCELTQDSQKLHADSDSLLTWSYYGMACVGFLLLFSGKKNLFLPFLFCQGMLTSLFLYEKQQGTSKLSINHNLQYIDNNLQEKIALLLAQKKELKRIIFALEKDEERLAKEGSVPFVVEYS